MEGELDEEPHFISRTLNLTSIAEEYAIIDTVENVTSYCYYIVAVSFLIGLLKDKNSIRVNDGITSITQAVLESLGNTFVTRGIESMVYIYIYYNLKLAELPCKELWAWVFGLTCLEMSYYWYHRASHEINIMWASHRVHHSSEDFNVTTVVRQPMLQAFYVIIFYAPLAFFIPPPMVIVHGILINLHNYLVHTEVIPKLGPLEYIINTPSSHRVHHGWNKPYIGKNYAGLLIIWDRIFGTYAEETEPPVYGLVQQQKSFSSFETQAGHHVRIFKEFVRRKGLRNKLSVIFKRTDYSSAELHQESKVNGVRQEYDPPMPFWCKCYVLLHFLYTVWFYIDFDDRKQTLSTTAITGSIIFLLYSFISFGALFDDKPYAKYLELFRCLLFLNIDHYHLPLTPLKPMPNITSSEWHKFVRSSFALSASHWIFYFVREKAHSEKKEQAIIKMVDETRNTSDQEMDHSAPFAL